MTKVKGTAKRFFLKADEVESVGKALDADEPVTLVRDGIRNEMPLWLSQFISDVGAEEASTHHHDDVVACCPWGPVGTVWSGLEQFALVWPDGDGPPENVESHLVEYRADGDLARLPGGWPDDMDDDPDCGRWRSAASMPGWASRWSLELVDAELKTTKKWTIEWHLKFRVRRVRHG